MHVLVIGLTYDEIYDGNVDGVHEEVNNKKTKDVVLDDVKMAINILDGDEENG